MPSHYPKGRSRIKTITGTIDLVAQEVSNKLIFSYESPDRTRGWIIRDAWLWVADPFQSLISTDSMAMLLGNLATDSNTFAREKLNDPDDNRAFAWANRQYQSRDGSNDFTVANAGSIVDNRFLIDYERIVTNDLYINAAYYAEGETDLAPKLAFYVFMEEVNISPSQSLLQQLKGIGQDIEN